MVGDVTPPQKHVHKYYLFETKAAFEPKFLGNATGPMMYERIEYAYLSCNCGDVIRAKVKDKE